MKKSKPPVVSFKDACSKFLSENNDQRIQYHCEFLLDLSNKLLMARTADEIYEAERFVDTLLHERTDIVVALNIALDRGLPVGYAGFQNGKKHEYFAVQARLMVDGIQHVMQHAASGDTTSDDIHQLMAWAESQAGKSIETAIEAYIDFLFPGRWDDLLILFDIGITGLLRSGAEGLYTTILPAAEPFFQKVFETPGILDVLTAGVEELERWVKSQAASKAGLARRKGSKDLRLLLLRKYDEPGKTWKSNMAAATAICEEMKNEIGKQLSQHRRIATVTKWIKEHNAARPSPPRTNAN